MDDDLRSLRSNDPEEEQDLFAAFSDDEMDAFRTPADDPFADMGEDPFSSLDTPLESDPFRELSSTLDASTDDDLFERAASAAPEPPPLDDFGADEKSETPDWLRELGVGEEEPSFAATASQPAPAKKKSGGLLSALVGRGPQGRALGMTAQQRMVLSIFLFLDVTVIGLLILLVIGAINI